MGDYNKKRRQRKAAGKARRDANRRELHEAMLRLIRGKGKGKK